MEMDMSEAIKDGSNSDAASTSDPKPPDESCATTAEVASSSSSTAAAATTTTTTTTVSLTLAKKRKTKKKQTSSATRDGAESVRQAFDTETSVRQQEDGSGNDGADDNKAPLVIPVLANKLRFQPTAAVAATAAAAKDDDNNNEDNEALEALQAQSTTSRNSQETNQDERSKRTIIMNIDGNDDSFQQRETQQFKSDLQTYPEPVPLDSEQYQRVPIADFGAALLRGMGWTGDDARNKRGGKNNNNNNDDTVMPRPHRLGLGAIPVAATGDSAAGASMDTHKRRRALRPDQLQQKQRLQQQQDEYQRQRQEQVAQDKQRTMQNGSIVYMRIPSTRSQGSVVAKVKQEESQEQYQQSRRYHRACILQLVGVPGLNMVRVQYENESVESIVKRGDIDRLVTRDELEQEPFFQTAATTSTTRESATTSNNNGKKRDKSPRPGGNGSYNENDGVDDYNDRKRVKQDPDDDDDDDDDGRPEKRRGRRSDDDNDSYRNKSSSSNKRSRHNGKDDDYSDDSSRRRKEVKKKKDSDRDRRRRDDDHHGESSKISRRETKEKSTSLSTSSSSTVYWATPHIRVRIISEKLGRRYFKEKAVVLDVTHKGITLQLSSSSNNTSLVLDRVPERYLETALPKAGGCVLVLRGNHQGVKGRLLERDSKRAVGIIQTSQDLEVLTLPLDDMAEWMGPIDDE